MFNQCRSWCYWPSTFKERLCSDIWRPWWRLDDGRRCPLGVSLITRKFYRKSLMKFDMCLHFPWFACLLLSFFLGFFWLLSGNWWYQGLITASVRHPPPSSILSSRLGLRSEAVQKLERERDRERASRLVEIKVIHNKMYLAYVSLYLYTFLVFISNIL